MSSRANVYTGPEQFNSDIRDLRSFAAFSPKWHEEFMKIYRRTPFPKREFPAKRNVSGTDKLGTLDNIDTGRVDASSPLGHPSLSDVNGVSSAEASSEARSKKDACEECHRTLDEMPKPSRCFKCATSHAMDEARIPSKHGQRWLHEGTVPPLFRYKEEYMARVAVLELKLAEQVDAYERIQEQSRVEISYLTGKVQRLVQACERSGNSTLPMSYKRRAVAMFDEEPAGRRHRDGTFTSHDNDDESRAHTEESSDDGGGVDASTASRGNHDNGGAGDESKRVSTRRRTPSLQLVESMSLQLAQAENAQHAQRAAQLLARQQAATKKTVEGSPKDRTRVGAEDADGTDKDHSSPVFKSFLHYGRDKTGKRPTSAMTGSTNNSPIVID